MDANQPDMRRWITLAETIDQPARLYHGTSAAAAIDILHTDRFLAYDTHGDGKGLGLSLTRNLAVAQRFAAIQADNARLNGSADWSPGYAEHLVDGTGGVVLVIDRNTLPRELMAIPRASDGETYGYEINGDDISDEEEERLLADAGADHILNARRCIGAIVPAQPARLKAFCAQLIRLDPDYRASARLLMSLIQRSGPA